jgi:hypothetical protein
MIASTWLLLIAFFLPNDQYLYYNYITLNKEDCIKFAKQEWRDFYRNPPADAFDMEAICRNKRNQNDFVRIECNKAGVCTQ